MTPVCLPEAAIFDLDGLLIDSEPFWQRAEKAVFGSLGVPVTSEESAYTSRLSTAAVARYWFNKSPWKERTLEEAEQDVIDHVRQLVRQEAMPMPGVRKVLEICRNRGLKIGLATNSPPELIPEILRKIGIEHYFDATASSVHEPAAKPEPYVYLTVAGKLNTPPHRCIAFEDSVSGMRAAIKAGMTTIVIPDATSYSRSEFETADIRLRSLQEFSAEHFHKIQSLITRRHIW